jgi:hypothetical protein
MKCVSAVAKANLNMSVRLMERLRVAISVSLITQPPVSVTSNTSDTMPKWAKMSDPNAKIAI